jgi:pimeloyl-ACP methyl ester carboxylesterase
MAHPMMHAPPRWRVGLLSGAGHSPHMEATNEVNRLVGAFLDELEGG